MSAVRGTTKTKWERSRSAILFDFSRRLIEEHGSANAHAYVTRVAAPKRYAPVCVRSQTHTEASSLLFRLKQRKHGKFPPD